MTTTDKRNPRICTTTGGVGSVHFDTRRRLLQSTGSSCLIVEYNVGVERPERNVLCNMELAAKEAFGDERSAIYRAYDMQNVPSTQNWTTSSTTSSQTTTGCVSGTDCSSTIDEITSGIRDIVADRIASEVDFLLDTVASATTQSVMKHEEGFLNLSIDVLNPPDSGVVPSRLNHFYYTLEALPEVHWLWYADSGTGRFTGVRRPRAAHYASTSAQSLEITAADKKVFLLSHSNGPTDPQKFYWVGPECCAEDAVTENELQGSNTDWDLNAKAWYQRGMTLQFDRSNPTASKNYRFTDVYQFGGDAGLGLSVLRAVKGMNSDANIGVMGADITLDFLEAYMGRIEVPQLTGGYPSPLFIIDSAGRLIANNVGASNCLTNLCSTTLTTNSLSTSLIKKAASALVDGVALQDTSQEGAWFRIEENGVEYRAEARFVKLNNDADYNDEYSGLRWNVIVVTEETMGFAVPAPESGTCIGTGKLTLAACEGARAAAATSLRSRVLKYLRQQTRGFLGTPVVVVNGMDLNYNMNTHKFMKTGGVCGGSPCPAIDVAGQDRDQILAHMKNLMHIYRELYWIYFAQEEPHYFLGYLRGGSAGQLRRWECSDPPTCDRVKFYEEDGSLCNDPDLCNDPVTPTTRAWYTTGMNLAYDEVQWIPPYKFGTGQMGVSLVKKAFGGNWDSTTGRGVWAADFLLEGTPESIGEHMAGLGVGNAVLYIYDRTTKRLIANNQGEAVVKNGEVVLVTASTTSLIKDTADTVIQMVDAGQLQIAAQQNTSMNFIYSSTSSSTNYFVDAVDLIDPDLNRQNSFDFVFVSVEEQVQVDIAVEAGSNPSPSPSSGAPSTAGMACVKVNLQDSPASRGQGSVAVAILLATAHLLCQM